MQVFCDREQVFRDRDSTNDPSTMVEASASVSPSGARPTHVCGVSSRILGMFSSHGGIRTCAPPDGRRVSTMASGRPRGARWALPSSAPRPFFGRRPVLLPRVPQGTILGTGASLSRSLSVLRAAVLSLPRVPQEILGTGTSALPRETTWRCGAVMWATLYYACHDVHTLLPHQGNDLLYFVRYLDDILGIWTGNLTTD